MLKKIIKTHTARLDFVDISGLLFLGKAIVYERERRVIASMNKKKKKNPKFNPFCLA